MDVCPHCGLDHHPELAEAVAEVDAAEAIADGMEGAAHEEARADVEIAKVEGETAIELARIDAKVQAGWQEERIVRMEGELSGMREVLDRLAAPPPDPEPEPEPAPVEVVDDGPPAPEETPAPPAPKKSKGWWG